MARLSFNISKTSNEDSEAALSETVFLSSFDLKAFFHFHTSTILLQTLLNIPRDLIYPKDSIEDSLQDAVLKAAGSTKGEIRFFGANASRAFPHSVRRKTHFAANRS